jgi:hypothetical protein
MYFVVLLFQLHFCDKSVNKHIRQDEHDDGDGSHLDGVGKDAFHAASFFVNRSRPSSSRISAMFEKLRFCSSAISDMANRVSGETVMVTRSFRSFSIRLTSAGLPLHNILEFPLKTKLLPTI